MARQRNSITPDQVLAQLLQSKRIDGRRVEDVRELGVKVTENLGWAIKSLREASYAETQELQRLSQPHLDAIKAQVSTWPLWARACVRRRMRRCTTCKG